MIHTAFFDVSRQTAHAAINGSQPPALGGKLLTHLKIIAKCFSGDDIVTVDADTAEFLILAKTSASGEASLIDTTAGLDVSDPDEPQYEFEWNPADSVQLRAVLDAAADPTAPVELRYEFRFERDGEKCCIGGPIWFLNNFFRPETPAPEATLNTSWDTLKSRVLAGANLTRTVDDAAKTMTFAGEDSEANAAAIAAETAARIAADASLQTSLDAKAAAADLAAHTARVDNPHVVTKAQVGLGNVDNTSDANKPVSTAQQAALDAKAAASHTHTIADTTGLQAALDGKAATYQKIDDFGTPDDNTDLNATTTRHGLLPKLGGGSTNFLRADGTWAAPGGGGGGMTNGDFELRGYTDAGHGETSPPDLTIEFLSFQSDGYIQFNFNGTDYTVQFATSDPYVSSPTFWADTSWASTLDDLAQCLYNALSGQITLVVVGNSGPVFTAQNSQNGSSANSACTGGTFSLNTSGGGQGQDSAGPSGELVLGTVLSYVSGKTIRPLRIGCFGTGVSVPVQVRFGIEVLGTFAANSTSGELLVTASNWQGWKGAANASISVHMVEADGSDLAPENTPTGGALTVWALASQ